MPKKPPRKAVEQEIPEESGPFSITEFREEFALDNELVAEIVSILINSDTVETDMLIEEQMNHLTDQNVPPEELFNEAAHKLMDTFHADPRFIRKLAQQSYCDVFGIGDRQITTEEWNKLDTYVKVNGKGPGVAVKGPDDVHRLREHRGLQKHSDMELADEIPDIIRNYLIGDFDMDKVNFKLMGKEMEAQYPEDFSKTWRSLIGTKDNGISNKKEALIHMAINDADDGYPQILEKYLIKAAIKELKTDIAEATGIDPVVLYATAKNDVCLSEPLTFDPVGFSEMETLLNSVPKMTAWLYTFMSNRVNIINKPTDDEMEATNLIHNFLVGEKLIAISKNKTVVML